MSDDASTPAGPEQARLAPIVGRWRTSGETVAGPDEPALTIRGTDTYEWFPGGHFLLHHVDVHMGPDHVRTLEVIGYSAESEAYTARAFDNSGAEGVMQLEIGPDTWRIADSTTQAHTTFSADGQTADVVWERRDDARAEWQPWMHLTLIRDA